MFHLDPETLARIADEPADEAEAAHLETCAECRIELEALREQTSALGALTPPPVPGEVWRGIEARLLGQEQPLATRRRFPATWLLRAAAAAALFLTGVAAGAAIDRDTPGGADSAPARTVPPGRPDPSRSLREAEALYADALARYMAEESDPEGLLDPTRRLAALESIILTAGAALAEKPEDVVIAGYYRTALAQREALLSQVQLSDSEVWF